MRSVLVLLTFVMGFGLALLGPVSVCEAQLSDDERARLHFESGRSYYEQARYDDAAREFQEAYKLSGRPALLLNLSQAYERALRFDEAIYEAQRYLQLVPDAADRRTQEERIGRLDQLRSRVQPQSGVQPAPAPVQPAPTWPAHPEGSQTAAPAAPAPAPAPSTPPPAQDDGNPMLVPGVVLLSVGGAALVGSLITGLVAHGKYNSLERACSGGTCPPSARDDIDSGETMAVVSTVLLGVGVAAAGVGVVLLLVGADDDETAAAAGDVRLSAGPTPLGLGAQLAF